MNQPTNHTTADLPDYQLLNSAKIGEAYTPQLALAQISLGFVADLVGIQPTLLSPTQYYVHTFPHLPKWELVAQDDSQRVGKVAFSLAGKWQVPSDWSPRLDSWAGTPPRTLRYSLTASIWRQESAIPQIFRDAIGSNQLTDSGILEVLELIYPDPFYYHNINNLPQWKPQQKYPN